MTREELKELALDTDIDGNFLGYYLADNQIEEIAEKENIKVWENEAFIMTEMEKHFNIKMKYLRTTTEGLYQIFFNDEMDNITRTINLNYENIKDKNYYYEKDITVFYKDICGYEDITAQEEAFIIYSIFVEFSKREKENEIFKNLYDVEDFDPFDLGYADDVYNAYLIKNNKIFEALEHYLLRIENILKSSLYKTIDENRKYILSQLKYNYAESKKIN